MACAMADQGRAVLVLCDADRVASVATLTADLHDAGAASVDVSSDADRLLHLDETGALYVDWSEGALRPDQERSLAAFVNRGGTLVAAGRTLATWSGNESIIGFAGWSPDGQTVRTELSVEPASDADATGSSFRVRDRVHLLPAAPHGASPLLVAHWRYARHVVAYTRAVGGGRFTYVGLADDPGTYANPEFRRLVMRCLRTPVASSAVSPLGIGLLGFGALGRAHVAAIEEVAGLRAVCVCDRDAKRREDATSLGYRTVVTTSELLAASDVDLVMVGTPPADHVASVLAALEAGKHVVCEKPFAVTTADCDRMIERATATGRVLTVFQNRRWDPDFLAVQRALRDGAIGELFYMESFVGEFAHPCHLWHSHQPISGGAVYDWGSHYVDWILQLFDADVASVRAIEHNRVWHDVTNADQISVEMKFDNGGQATFMQSHVAAASKPKWYLLGTRGAVVADWQHVTERVRGPDGEMDEHSVAPTDLPALVHVMRPDGAGGTHVEELSLPTRDRSAFYRHLAGHLHFGDPLPVTAAQARRTVAVMEAATHSAQRGGAPVTARI
jgi:predicted dehydrogenase